MKIPPHMAQIVIPVHLLSIIAITMMVTQHDYMYLIATFVGWTLISGWGIAIGFHRVLSHKALPVTRLVRNLLSYLGCLGIQGSPMFWVALHRGYHHPFSDTPKDFHSPIHGYWSAYMGWMFKFKATDISFKYAVDLLRDDFQLLLHKRYNAIVWGTIFVAVLLDWKLAMYGLIIPMVLGLHQECLVDLVCHLRALGYRNHDTKDNSCNNPLLGWFGWGQGWHNNHHKSPGSYNFGQKWWEFDPTRLFTSLLSFGADKTKK